MSRFIYILAALSLLIGGSRHAYGGQINASKKPSRSSSLRSGTQPQAVLSASAPKSPGDRTSAVYADPYSLMQAGFTQELFAVAPTFFGGVAFAPDGDVWVDECQGGDGLMYRFDQQSTYISNGSVLHPQVSGSPFSSGAGCGLANHPNGSIYSNTEQGVVRIDGNTGAVLGGPFGPGGDALGIAVDPQTGDIVYVGGPAFDGGTILRVDPSLTTVDTFSNATAGDWIDGIVFDPTGTYLLMSNRSPALALTILKRDGSLVQNIPVTSEPDGIGIQTSSPKFVITSNTDGTITRYDFPSDDYTQVPAQSLFASGGFRGDLLQVGADGCIYLTQDGTRYADGTETTEDCIVRICPGFAPPPGVTLCESFFDKQQFEDFNRETTGKLVKGIETFEEAVIQPGGKNCFTEPLGPSPNPPNFPDGLQEKNIIIQTNVTPGPSPALPNPSGSGCALYVVDSNFIGSNSRKVGEDLFLQNIQASLDLIFTEPLHTGVGFDLSRFDGFPTGGWVVTTYDTLNQVIGVYNVPAPGSNEPFKSFFGVWCQRPIGRINIYDSAGVPAPDAIDNIELWKERPPSNCPVCVSAWYDVNHNQQPGDGDDEPMSGVNFVLTDPNNVQTTYTTDASGKVCFEVVPGKSLLQEVVPAGYTNSVPKDGGPISIICNGTDPVPDVLWLNAAAAVDSTFRTATYYEWAQARDAHNKQKPVPCKPDKVEFKLNLVIPATPTSTPNATPFTRLKLGFSIATQITAVWADGKGKEVPLPCGGGGPLDTKLKVWGYTFDGCIPGVSDPGDTLQFDGVGLKGVPIKVVYVWSNTDAPKPQVISGTLTVGRKGGVRGDTLKQVLRLPMPNLVNVMDEIARQVLVQTPVAIGATADSHSVVLTKLADVEKSLVKITRGGDLFDQNGSPRCLDFLTDPNGNPLPTKPIKKPQKGLTPDKYQNPLFAQQLALKLNVLASDHAKFPVGFGDLIYDNHKSCNTYFYTGCTSWYDYCTDPVFDGKSVRTIMAQADSILSCRGSSKGADAYAYWLVLLNLNQAFSGCPVDTERWSCLKLVLKGGPKLKDIPYLRAPDPGVGPYSAPAEPSVARVEPSQFQLQQNYPNPFNPTTTIAFELAEDANVTLVVYNAIGQQVATILNHELYTEGDNDVVFNASNLPSGVYFYRLEAQGIGDPDANVAGKTYTSVRKMVLVK